MTTLNKLTIASLFACAALAARADSWSRADAEALLARWADSLLRYQVKGTGDGCLDGGVLCPACNFEHGRVADSVYALVYRWKQTGERRYLDAAAAMLDWTERNTVDCDGANYNDTKHYWRGITVFSQTSLGKTLLAFGDDLPAELKAKWLQRFRVQTDFLVGYFSNGLGSANINYPITFCEAMAVAYRLLGDETYKRKAEAMIALVKPLFLADGLLAGEGHPSTGVSPRGCRPVDLGYNLEESIPALYHYAELVDDQALLAELDRLVAGHFEFLLPDGGLDNSMGSRSCKWTYWGSRTSDGLLPAFAHYAKRGGKGAVRTIDRHLALLARCTSDTGLLYGGLSYREAGEPPCLHHTFAHVKSLVDLLLIAPPEKSPDEPMPREAEYGRKRIASMDTELVAVGPWRASFSANDNYSNHWGTDIGGGSLTMLWHPAFGPVCAATMNEYHYVEPTNFQDQRKYIGVMNLTPRIEREKFRSVADKTAKVTAAFADGVFSYAAEGVLTDLQGQRGEPFKLAYALTKDGLDVRATLAEGARYVLPVMTLPEDEVKIEGEVATIRRAGGTIVVKADRPLTLLPSQRGQLAFNPIAGLMAAPLVVEGPGEVKLTLRVERARDAVWESAREVPVVTNVDVVVVGGTSAGVAAAVAARRSGATVYLASAMPYLGEDLAGTLELGATPEDRTDPLVRKLWTRAGGLADYSYRVDVDKDGPWVYRHDFAHKLSESADPRTTRDSLRHTGDTSVYCTLAEPSELVAIEAIAFDRPDIVPPADQSQDARQEADRERAARDARSHGRTSVITAEILSGDNQGMRIDLKPVDTLWVEGDYKSGKAHAVVFRGAVTGVVSKARLDFVKDPEVNCQFVSRIRFRRPAGTVREAMPTPLKVKRGLDAELLDADVDFLTASPVCEVLRDDAGRAAGVVMANRSGRQVVRAKCVIDATSWGVTEGEPPDLTSVSRVIKAKTRPEVVGARVSSVDEANGLWRIEKDVARAKPDWRTLAAVKVASDDWSWQDGLADQSAWPVFRFAPRSVADVPGVWRASFDGALGERLARARTVGRAAAEAARGRQLPVPRAAGRDVQPAEAGDTRELLGGLRAWERRRDETVRLGAARLPVLAETDTVVVGLGTAGTAAAVGAARGGARTIGIECSPVPGGIGTEGLIGGYYDGNRVGFQQEFERLIGTDLKGRTNNTKFRRVLAWRRLLADAGVESWYGCFASGVYLREPGVAGGVVVVTPFGRGVVLAKNVIDATGNSEIAAAAGAETVFGGQGEFALQSAGLSPYRAGSGGVNSDFGYVNDTDARDAWLFMVKGRAGARDAWDVSSILDTRERRRIGSDYRLEGWDVTAGRRFPDTIVQSRSRQDSHGYLVDDYWFVQPKHDPRVPRDVNVPLRSLLPRGLSNLAVIGLGAGVARDVMPFVRMQADFMNMGYAVGLLSATGEDFRRADLRRLQYRLVEEGVLRAEVLGWTDDPEPDEAALAQAVANMKDGFADSGIVWRCRERARPLVEEAYRTASTDAARLAYATVLGLWGSPLGSDDLIAAYARHPQNLGIALALGRCHAPGASEALIAQLKQMSAKEDLRLVRGVCLGLEAAKDPAAAPHLAAALRRPGVSGHDLHRVSDVPAMGGYGLSPVVDRSLVELAYARALLACGDFEGLGRAIYHRYAEDVRGFLAEHAHRVLAKLPADR